MYLLGGPIGSETWGGGGRGGANHLHFCMYNIAE